jgi:molybdopterin-guanine dinucleotide biosynthesis protein A
MDNTAVVLLAGGRARRFPGKLEHRVAGEPLLLRCYERVRAGGWPVYVAGASTFARETDARIDAPILIDRHPFEGPLRAFLSACATIAAERVFAIAADQPDLDAAVLQRIAQSWRDGDEAVVPKHEKRIEPLAALYSRVAALREASALRRDGKSAMHDLIARVAARFIVCDAAVFRNLNRIEDVA